MEARAAAARDFPGTRARHGPHPEHVRVLPGRAWRPLVLLIGFNWLSRRKWARLASASFPPEWEELIARNLPYWKILPQDDREELKRHVLVLLGTKRFEGCGGLELSQEMKLTIASQASVLLLHRETEYYPALESILVYPEPFSAPIERALDGGMVLQEDEERSGESWDQGTLVLAWNEILETSRNPGDGFNVIYHEFAHQLDREDGEMNGVPLLPDRAAREEWARVFSREFSELSRFASGARKKRGRKTAASAPLIDEYGASDPGEFFAVTTETFFELPLELREEHAELYAQLKRYFRQDPAELWERYLEARAATRP